MRKSEHYKQNLLRFFNFNIFFVTDIFPVQSFTKNNYLLKITVNFDSSLKKYKNFFQNIKTCMSQMAKIELILIEMRI